MATSLEFLSSPQEFLDAAGGFLADRPVASTVPASVTQRILSADADGIPRDGGFDYWWLVVRDGAGEVVGAGMRTASFPPYPPYLLTMPEAAARELARVLVARGEQVDGLNGALPAAPVCAEELATLTGREVEVVEHIRLFELRALVPPARTVLGGLRSARDDEVGLVLAWYDAFDHDAAEQAGRGRPHPGPQDDDASMLRRIRSRSVWFWVDERDVPVCVVGLRPPAYGVSCIGPVYTPKEHRGHGYASAAVHDVSAGILASGARACLFTDQANPTSNAIYQRLGYVAVEDQVNQLLR